MPREAAPIGLGAGNILEDLCFEGVGRGELALGAEEAVEIDFDVGGGGVVEGSEKEGLDGELVAAEGGADAAVGNGRPAAAGGGRAGFGDEDAARDELAGGRQKVESGDGLLGADAVAGDNGSNDREAAAEEAGGARRCPDDGAGDDFAATRFIARRALRTIEAGCCLQAVTRICSKGRLRLSRTGGGFLAGAYSVCVDLNGK